MQYVTGIYLPSAALLIGTAAFKSEWLPYAIALTAVLTGAVIFSSQGMLNCSLYLFTFEVADSSRWWT